MRITALVENQSHCELEAHHGLSLYIETKKHTILFDVGPGRTLFKNCKKRSIDLSKVDIVILSHGHMDHGGALEQFLKCNAHAKVYAQRTAFEKHTSKHLLLEVNIGLDTRLQTHPQMVLLDGDTVIDDELVLFTFPNREKCYSSANDSLYAGKEKDNFSHEQNLMILGKNNTLIMGCGHAGIVNILENAADYTPKVCVGGYHLWGPTSQKTVSDELLEKITKELAKYDIQYYTCHCTGVKAAKYLADRLPNMHYLSCGEMVQLSDI